MTLRPGDTEPSVCMCLPCGMPLEGFNHSRCPDPVELVACPQHREEQRRRMGEATKGYDQRAAESGFDEKRARMKALPDGEEKHAFAEEIVERLFR